MSTPHKATPDQWEKVKYLARLPNSHWAIVSCLLELRARVEVLESDGPAVSRDREPASVAMQPTPASSLVERVAIALAESDHPHQLWHDEARAAIHEVAAWIREEWPASGDFYATELEQEASK
jgi:hypothetical protein